MRNVLYLLPLCLLLGCVGPAQIAALERRQNYIFEVLRGRTLSVERCESFSDDWMTCTSRLQSSGRVGCGCTFQIDEQDIENARIVRERAMAEQERQRRLEEARDEEADGKAEEVREGDTRGEEKAERPAPNP